MHMKTFARFHVQKQPIDSLRDMLEFAQENGLDVAKVGQAWNSFSVQTKCSEAKRLEDDYGIERMPEMAIAGRFVAVAQAEQGPASVLVTTDWLVNRCAAAADSPPAKCSRRRDPSASVGRGRQRRINPVRKGASRRAPHGACGLEWSAISVPITMRPLTNSLTPEVLAPPRPCAGRGGSSPPSPWRRRAGGPPRTPSGPTAPSR